MKRNFWKKILFCGAALGMVATLAIGISPVNALAEETPTDYVAKTDDYYSYVQKFEDVDAVNNAFHAYYRENALGSAKTEIVSTSATATDTHWYIEDGVLSRINNVQRDEDSGAYETNQVAILTFTKDAYLNFELSVDVKRGAEGFWPVIGIRQLEEGKYHLDDGAGVFVQQNGMITLWGDPVVSGPYEFATVSNYNDSQWHNLQIKVLGNTLYVSVDNAPWEEQALPSAFYDTGYVSLISVNNRSQYRNFRFKALAEPVQEEYGEFLPETEASTNDALSNLAGDVKDGEPFEREGKVNPDLVYKEWQDVVVGDGEKGCNGSIGLGVGCIFIPATFAFVIRRKKK